MSCPLWSILVLSWLSYGCLVLVVFPSLVLADLFYRVVSWVCLVLAVWSCLHYRILYSASWCVFVILSCLGFVLSWLSCLRYLVMFVSLLPCLVLAILSFFPLSCPGRRDFVFCLGFLVLFRYVVLLWLLLLYLISSVFSCIVFAIVSCPVRNSIRPKISD